MLREAGFCVPIGFLDEDRSLGLRLAFMARMQWVQHEKADVHVLRVSARRGTRLFGTLRYEAIGVNTWGFLA